MNQEGGRKLDESEKKKQAEEKTQNIHTQKNF